MAGDFERLLSRYDPSVRRLARSTRRLVRRFLPSATEQVDSGGRIGYGVGARMTDTVCVIMLSKAGVKLGLYDGAKLSDPSGLLKGVGKRHRHVPLPTPATLESPALVALLRRAVTAKHRERRAT
ncbi:MAG TPA: DUF1801 domain-containing protein [Gemmatimonadales bacterium]|nr:DUF1801 domain-containing protein [Gemmatimonadales bacterium]